MKRTFEVNPWTLTTHDLNPTDKRLQESITSLGNEYMGMRGMFEEQYSGDTHQGIYVGGVWFPDKTRVGWWKNGYPLYFGKAINALNFMKANIYVDGKQIDLAVTKPDDFEISLDMQKGTLKRTFSIYGVKFIVTRLISAATKELADLYYEISSTDGNAHSVKYDASIDANVVNEDSNYDEKFWQVLSNDTESDSSYVSTQTIPNDFGVPQFTVVARQGFVGGNKTNQTKTDDQVTDTFEIKVTTNKVSTFEKRVIVTTSRDYDSNEATIDASSKLLSQIASANYQDIYAAHIAEWGKRWEKADVQIEGDDAAQQGIRFNLFHLFSTYYGNDPRLNIGPKGFTGEKYGGATYWDTEAFAIPVYLGVADPKVTRSLLQYRFEQLDGAKHNAKQQDLAGALYPMVTFDGIESHNEWEITFEEIHRNSTIAYAIYNYTNITGDRDWIEGDGAQVLYNIARFWADRVHYSARKDKFMIHGVTGPNEYENNVNNNFYTNWMAKWVLQYSIDNYPTVNDDEKGKLGITPDELTHWQEIANKMYLPQADVEINGEIKHIFEQNDTFLDKELIPAADLDPKIRPINQHWSWDRILRSPYIKQSDTLHAMFYFPDAFTEEEKRNNFEFYEPLTVHESSLSPSVHSILAADLKMEDKAVEMYERAARLDLDNYNNDTADGLHITAMTGSWLSIVQGFAGMRVRDGKLHLAPFLPSKWTEYSFRLVFRGHVLEVHVNQKGTEIELISGDSLVIDLNGTDQKLD
ncbi:trehalose or maltose hydrolase (phosphorylases) [Paucilactobacillus oligofermentans DSM 15707 = LMG 22743]|uniref:Trehalose or maltose hydrolase (Phosphorylases) n=1 Tax=Paucilactobacillus oligofermentans DSM 15707 = LMG 22743 TaxID=1423778 RepID=A0A0R1RDC4_9LACO|nr:glycoside hydrolase family 65 protein [Paucilactobacillus oligofermentans]KRL54855.1 trehalose or maltose hydrolase (phosphorylases) [Paucilactobacillus oligofermentans DSM 15707 = LMG 22743]CUS26230.1 Maltose phosphorylase [Paucilactobacillus oligofermentans DSM 15707 = LMG 22743]